MPDRRLWLMALGIPGLLLYGTLGVAQWRSSLAMNEFTGLQKAYPPGSLKKVPAEVQLRKLQALTLTERLAPDNPEIAYQTSLFHLVRAETESLQPPSDFAGSENENDSRLVASLKDGLAWIDRAIILNPGYAEYQFVKASILQNLSGLSGEEAGGDSTEAVASLLREADRLDPYKPSLHFRIGSFWIALDERDAAKACFAVSLRGDKGFADSVFSVLWSTMTSVDELREIVEHEPRTCVLLGEFLVERGLNEEGEREYREALGGNLRDYQAVGGIIRHFFSQKRYKDILDLVARADRDRWFAKAEERAGLTYAAGMAHYQRGELEIAIAEYEQSLKLDPSQLHIHHTLAMAFLQHRDYSQAIARWRFALSSNWREHADKTSLVTAHLGLGQAYEAMGNLKDALDEYLQAAKIEPANATVALRIHQISEKL